MNAKKPKFPIVVKRGSCAVKIYRDQKPEGIYFRVAYYLGGKRYRLNFRDLQTATNEAEAKASQLSRGDLDAVHLSGRDRLIYGRALDAVKEFDLPLDAVAIEYNEARKLLDGVSMMDAARFYARHHGGGITRQSVSAGVDEMIAAKQSAGVSDVYLSDLRYRLGVFANRFQCDLVSITRDDARQFLAGLKLSARSHNNFIGALKTFFSFAEDRAWLSKEADLLASTNRRKEKSTPVEIFTPAEMRALLEHATPEMAVCMALGGFAGLRSQEVLRLEWADLTRRPGFVEIAAEKAKTAARRLVPIADNLGRWLALTAPGEGRIWKHTKATFFKIRLLVASEAKVSWKQNALRHSFISYRLAEIADMNRVALEAGNSPQMIFRHYRELATPEQARTWFAIAPEVAANVVPMQRRAGQ
ncbi:MAG: hypothetical protein ABI016_15370 [Chthoniobacterales bacterium]